MGPENMKEGELYFSVLQKDGTPGEWQKWEGFTEVIEETHKPTVKEIVDTLTAGQLRVLDYLVGAIFKSGSLQGYDINLCASLALELNDTQKAAVVLLMKAARKEWEKKNEIDEKH